MRAALVFVGLASVWMLAGVKAGAPAGLRRPVALVLSPDGRWLFVANQRSGSISVIDVGDDKVVAEVSVGRRLSYLALTANGRLLATDEETHELIVVAYRGSTLAVTQRVAVAPYPVSVSASADGTRAFVASLWSRQINFIELTPQPRQSKVLSLPFAPRQLLLVSGDQKLLVADAFGGNLGVVDVGRFELDTVRSLAAHNIRGLTLSRDGERLLLAHQVLRPTMPTTRDAIHWGNLLTNNLRVLRLADVLTAGSDLLRDSRLIHLGKAGTGAGDPAGATITADGLVLTTLGGVGQLAIGAEVEPDEKRIAVGRRPTAVLAHSDGRRAYVADTLGDCVVAVDLRDYTVTARIPLGPETSVTPEVRGEIAFYDARLSHDGWLSCHSCHTDGHTTGGLNDNFGDGSYGAPKRILSLRGVGETGPWAWNGGMADLEAQVRKSIQTTMHGPKPSDELVRDLTAFLRTLPAAPAVQKLRGDADKPRAQRGEAVFRDQGCTACHTPPAYTAARTYDVGLSDAVGQRHFSPPSLRGVSQGGPFFHDGRANTLDDVFVAHRHQIKGDLTLDQFQDLLAFLRSI